MRTGILRIHGDCLLTHRIYPIAPHLELSLEHIVQRIPLTPITSRNKSVPKSKQKKKEEKARRTPVVKSVPQSRLSVSVDGGVRQREHVFYG